MFKVNDTLFTGAVCMSITAVGNTTNLPLSDPFCNTDACLAFAKAHKASQNAVSYTHQFDYGHYTTWYYLAVLGVGMAVHLLRLYRNRNLRDVMLPSNAFTATGHKALALGRTVAYRSAGGATAARWGIPKLGLLIFGIFTLLFFLLMTFLVHPYYRERRGYGSPPLAVRAGLMSTALIPLILALSGKVNIVTWLTGISHEKLNVFHRWASYLCLLLAVVHTVPFIVTPLQTCGADGLHAQFYKPRGFEYTGVPPLGMLVGLCALSVPIVFITLSTDSMSLSTSLFLGSYSGMLGQHCWLRMPHLSLLQSHPFTIANLSTQELGANVDMKTMEFYIRAYSGLTRSPLKSLADYNDHFIPMHVDGPYGGLSENLPEQYESLVFVCGGSGVSVCLPHILHAFKAYERGSSLVSSIRFVWMVRHLSHAEWVAKTLKEASNLSGLLHVDIYITGPAESSIKISGTEIEKTTPTATNLVPQVDELIHSSGQESANSLETWTVNHTRPYL
ncbi:ferric reductase like transmembrane component-domain-containing protein [Penicillium longicatenatum]|uniref:ferric reductase like transmembrane component-domain-containing protein n=1 Tax=Penicillium longicatenatum TaxID=1561947 RepID=UPI002549B264|nr:ferric reductase like transmembrane component-domain-containing protein [Penicillium longicatenatum]KAJ5639581.1 ferric reductase like transmembrane component-domain-containing protein [Penicillium longicatenatum]